MCIVLLHVNYLDYDNRGLGGLEKRRVLKKGSQIALVLESESRDTKKKVKIMTGGKM